MTSRAAAGVCGLIAVAALWLPWFQAEGNFIVLFGALDRQSENMAPTAWQAFGWEDVVLAVAAGATVAVAMTGRRWFAVPAAGAVFSAGVLLAHRSVDLFRNFEQEPAFPRSEYPLPAAEGGFVALLAFAMAAVALAAGRYRLRRR